MARRLEDLPVLKEAFASGTLSYSKARAVSRIATPATERPLVDCAHAATASQLERLARSREFVSRRDAEEVAERRDVGVYDDQDGSVVFHGRLTAAEGEVLRAALTAHRQALRSAEQCSAEHKCRPSLADAFVAMAQTALAAGPTPLTGADRTQVILHVEETGATWLGSGAAVSGDTAKRLACDATVRAMLEGDGEPLKLGRATRTPNRAQRRALSRRDGGCRFPGCVEHRFVEAHHIIHWFDGGPTDLENLVLLCWRHHHLVHEGGWTLTGPAGRLEVRDSKGKLLCPRPPLFAAVGPTLEEQNRALGLGITAKTPELVAYNHRPDYSQAVEALLWQEEHALAN